MRQQFEVVEATQHQDRLLFDCPFCGNHSIKEIPQIEGVAQLTEYFSVTCDDSPDYVFLVHWR